ncbi:J domain-containing protein [Noviherbaspirillum sp.]|uniref:J domain-containing protein n=1 Tax=Noviherbaspirillum sp. TaxID=1926288 RepID=UPI0039C906F1
MARVHTHYDNLKVARDAPPEVIRAAYKTLSQKHHPDRNGNSANAMRIIQIINVAYEVLSDPVKRREHDEWITRMEADDASAREIHHHSHRHAHRHSSRRTHRSVFHFHGSRYKSLLDFSRLAHKLRMMLDHFSRKLFRKT